MTIIDIEKDLSGFIVAFHKRSILIVIEALIFLRQFIDLFLYILWDLVYDIVRSDDRVTQHDRIIHILILEFFCRIYFQFQRKLRCRKIRVILFYDSLLSGLLFLTGCKGKDHCRC